MQIIKYDSYDKEGRGLNNAVASESSGTSSGSGSSSSEGGAIIGEGLWQKSNGEGSLVPAGSGNVAEGTNSVAIGTSTVTMNEGELATGKFNETRDGETLFEVGDGLDDASRHNAFEVTTGGNTRQDGVANVGTAVETPVVKADKGILKTTETEYLNVTVQALINELLAKDITTENLTVTKAAHFFKLVIDEIKASKGQIIITPANATFDLVENVTGGWRCYFRATDGNKDILNSFEKDDMVICQTFNAAQGESYDVSNKYYWRRCINVSTEVARKAVDGIETDCWWIDLSSTDCDVLSNGVPEAGDEAVQLGNKTDSTRRSAIIISAYNNTYLDPEINSPSIVQYDGIKTYELKPYRKNVISKGYNSFTGKFFISGSNEDIEDTIWRNRRFMYTAWANSPDGKKDFTKTNPDATRYDYIGFCTSSNATDAPLTYADYTWSPVIGNGIKQTSITYCISDDGNNPPESGWQQTVPVLQKGKWLWTRIIIYYDNGESSTSYSVSRNGNDGSEVKSVYKLTDTNNAPTIPSTATGPDVPSGWSGVPLSATSTNMYCWTSQSTRTNDTWSKWTTPVLWSKYADRGSTGLHYELRYKNEATIPAKPATGSDGTSNGWSATATTPPEGQYTWMTQTTYTPNDTGGTYGAWTTPVRITGPKGETGTDGTDVEFIYTRNDNDNNPPAAPATTQEDDWHGTDPETGYVWTDNPRGIDAENRFEYVSVRYKTYHLATDTYVWSPYTSPVVWSKWGEKGQDGDGIKYLFYRTNNASFNTLPSTDKWDGSTIPAGWTDDPQGINADHVYEFVSICRRVANEWGYWSIPALWARYASRGINGSSTVLRYRNAVSLSDSDKPAAGSNGTGNGWYETAATPPEGQHTWMTQTTYTPNDTGGTYGTWTTPVRITGPKGETGADGADVEFIFARTETDTTTPAVPVSASSIEDNPSLDYYIAPDGTIWYDSPKGIDTTYKLEYVSMRYKTNGAWGTFSPAVIWSKWSEKGQDGDGVKYIYKATSAKPNQIEYPYPRQYSGTGVPTGWTDDPSGVDANNKYEYVSVCRSTNGAWGEWSKPVIWNEFVAAPVSVGEFMLYRYKVAEGRPIVRLLEGPNVSIASTLIDGWKESFPGLSSTIYGNAAYDYAIPDGSYLWMTQAKCQDSNYYDQLYDRVYPWSTPIPMSGWRSGEKHYIIQTNKERIYIAAENDDKNEYIAGDLIIDLDYEGYVSENGLFKSSLFSGDHKNYWIQITLDCGAFDPYNSESIQDTVWVENSTDEKHPGGAVTPFDSKTKWLDLAGRRIGHCHLGQTIPKATWSFNEYDDNYFAARPMTFRMRLFDKVTKTTIKTWAIPVYIAPGATIAITDSIVSRVSGSREEIDGLKTGFSEIRQEWDSVNLTVENYTYKIDKLTGDVETKIDRSEINQLADSITSTVEQRIDGKYVSSSQIRQTADEISATVKNDLSQAGIKITSNQIDMSARYINIKPPTDSTVALIIGSSNSSYPRVQADSMGITALQSFYNTAKIGAGTTGGYVYLKDNGYYANIEPNASKGYLMTFGTSSKAAQIGLSSANDSFYIWGSFPVVGTSSSSTEASSKKTGRVWVDSNNHLVLIPDS